MHGLPQGAVSPSTTSTPFPASAFRGCTIKIYPAEPHGHLNEAIDFTGDFDIPRHGMYVCVDPTAWPLGCVGTETLRDEGPGRHIRVGSLARIRKRKIPNSGIGLIGTLHARCIAS